MGCVSSKPEKCRRCRHCRRPYPSLTRSYSMQVHHPPQAKGDSYHVVALTSSTLGSLELGNNGESRDGGGSGDHGHRPQNDDYEKDFKKGLAEAKSWSSTITEKIPKSDSKTPKRSPPVVPEPEPETINTWELMEGLEDYSPLWTPTRFRSLSFDFSRPDRTPKQPDSTDSSSKPLWFQIEEEEEEDDEKNVRSDPEFDPEVISSFRESLQQLSPDHPFHLRAVQQQQQPPYAAAVDSKKFHDGSAEKVTLYFTSLRGVRKTYEDCCNVRAILNSIGVRVDERDVSMHSGFKEELRKLVMEGENIKNNGGNRLPRVFIGRKEIGGAEEICRLHEDGKLEKLLDCCEKLENVENGVCEGCGDIRFVPCETCFGSCKVFYEEEDEDEEENGYGFQRCIDCNENGLIRCPICCH